MPGPLITLTTDFGLADPSVPICKGVILSIVPDARIVDVSHSIALYDVAEGAALLWATLPDLPGTHMAVVDPGVGTSRRPVALRTQRGDSLVGPDNGLLVPAAEALGGIVAARELTNPDYRRPNVSNTFHARDVFAPAAAHLAAGVPIDRFGPPVDPATLVRLQLQAPIIGAGFLEATITSIDSFGTAQLLATTADLTAALGELRLGDTLTVSRPGGSAVPSRFGWHRTYGDVEVGGPITLEDSYGRVALAVNRGSAAAMLGLRRGERVRLARG